MTLAVNIAQSGSNNVTFRNKIINGAMVINQRVFSGNVTTNQYTLDRWLAISPTDSGKFSVSQNSTTATGFSYSLLATSLTAYTVLTNDRFSLAQAIEGYNTADLSWGTANAQTVTLSFWVRSSLTGTFGGALQNSGGDRSYPFTFTISSANTFEYKTITIAGPTSGTWNTTNGVGMYVYLGLGVGATYSGTAGAWANTDYRSATGATSLVSTNGATLYITGVQLEAVTTASPFEYRQYGTELALCQRYFQRNVFDNDSYPFSAGYAYANNTVAAYLPLAVAMRATPTAAIVVNMSIRGNGLTNQNLSSLGTIYQGLQGVSSVLFCNPTTSGTNLTAAYTYVLCNQGGQSGFTLSAELL
jgi:hypothetical protein